MHEFSVAALLVRLKVRAKPCSISKDPLHAYTNPKVPLDACTNPKTNVNL